MAGAVLVTSWLAFEDGPVPPAAARSGGDRPMDVAAPTKAARGSYTPRSPAPPPAPAPSPSGPAPVDLVAGTPFLPGFLADTADTAKAPAKPPAGEEPEALKQLRRARAAGYSRLDFLIATVPDPIDSSFPEDFDSYVAAIRLALEAAGYVSDLFFDPWAVSPAGEGAPAGASLHRTEPGILLFRRGTPGPTTRSDLMAVLLVGESPTWGVQKSALVRSLDMVDEFCGPRVTRTSRDARALCGLSDGQPTNLLRLLGPATSGAAESIRATVSAWLIDRMSPQPLGFRPAWRLEICSGSATAPITRDILERQLPESVREATGWTIPVHYRGTVNDDEALLDFVIRYLTNTLDARPNEIAILTESNTTYGHEFRSYRQKFRSTRATRGQRAGAGADADADDVPMTLAFPLHISRVREQRDESSSRTDVGRGFFMPRRLLTLKGRTSRPRSDTIDVHGPLTTNSTDLALTDLLRTIATEPIRYVGILATDVLDAVFLAEQVHEQFPQVVTVFFTSSLLYLHEDLAFLNGALVASTYPLGAWTKRMSFPFAGDELRLLFSSEYAQGTYNAGLMLTEDLRPDDDIEEPRDYLDYGPPFVNSLAGGKSIPFAPPLWMSVIESGQFWPLQVAPAPAKGYVQSVRIVDEARTVLERDRRRAWAPPTFSVFEWVAAFLALASLCVCGAYWSTRRKGCGWPLASRRIRHLVAPALGFPHPALHRFAILTIFVVLGLVLAVACIPLALDLFVAAVVTGPAETSSVCFAALMTMAVVATGANILRGFCEWLRTALGGWLASLEHRRHRLVVLLHRAVRRASAMSLPFLVVSAVGFAGVTGAAVLWMRANRIGSFNPTPEGVKLALFALRTRALGGASLLGVAGLLGLATIVWTFAQLRQVRLHQNAQLLRGWGVLLPYGHARQLFSALGVAKPVDDLIRRVEGVWPTPRTWAVMLVFDACAGIVANRLVIFDRLPLRLERVLPFAFVLMMGLLFWGCARALGAWRELRRLLAVAAILPISTALANLPRGLLEVFRAPLSNETEQVWRGYCLQLGRHLSLALPMGNATTADLLRIVGAREVDWLADNWISRGFRDTMAPDQVRDCWTELVSLRVLAFVGYVRAHIFNGIGAVTAATLPLLWLTTMYPFQSSRVLLALALALVMASVGVTLFVLVQMNRNEIISRLEGTTPGRVSWDFSFVSGLLVHGALPVVALVSVKFPALGRTITDWAFALLHGFASG